MFIRDWIRQYSHQTSNQELFLGSIVIRLWSTWSNNHQKKFAKFQSNKIYKNNLWKCGKSKHFLVWSLAWRRTIPRPTAGSAGVWAGRWPPPWRSPPPDRRSGWRNADPSPQMKFSASNVAISNVGIITGVFKIYFHISDGNMICIIDMNFFIIK